jgi:hypothetical protein
MSSVIPFPIPVGPRLKETWRSMKLRLAIPRAMIS